MTHTLVSVPDHLVEQVQALIAQDANPNEAEAFIADFLARVEARETVSAADVARIKSLAHWADAAPAPGWNGSVVLEEARRCVADARRRLAEEKRRNGQ